MLLSMLPHGISNHFSTLPSLALTFHGKALTSLGFATLQYGSALELHHILQAKLILPLPSKTNVISSNLFLPVSIIALPGPS